jgi:hypothetical protein
MESVFGHFVRDSFVENSGRQALVIFVNAGHISAAGFSMQSLLDFIKQIDGWFPTGGL